MNLLKPPDREEDGQTRDKEKDVGKETGCVGDSREREVVSAWCVKALRSWSFDRLVKLRRAQGYRPEGFTGIFSFLCGSSVSATATTDPLAPA